MSTPIAIAFLCHPYHRGGVTRWMADAAAAAAATGQQVYFVTPEPSKEFVSAGGRETMAQLIRRHPGVRLAAQPVGFSFEFGSEAVRADVYRHLLQRHVPAGTPVIVSDDAAVWAGAASVADKYPMIGVLHGDQDYYYDIAIKYRKQLSLFVCVSGRIRRKLLERAAEIPAGRVFTIPCGVDMPTFAPTAVGEATRLIFIGRLTDYEKRAEDLVKIAGILHEQHFPFHFDIVGNSPESAVTFGQYFKDAGVQDAVTFHGWQGKEKIQELLNAADIAVLTSNSEGMPLVMMEALASGCGFVGTRVSGVEDYERHPGAVWCVGVYTVGDVEAGAKAIKTLAATNRQQRQLAARQLAEKEFGMQVCLQRYNEAISGLSCIPASAAAKLSLRTADKVISYLRATARLLKVKTQK